ncbi:MAG: aminotransferase class V-fold PLP-dependent enzyme [Longimicrobiales bacterium]|nr:aminotransferase class V-fold PLP-dependent enzyme [Longimicrobiales bacterium]
MRAQWSPGSTDPFLPPEVRAHFPGALDKVYMNVALKGLIPRATAEAAHAHVEEALHATGDKNAHMASVERCREMFAALIGADADEVAITKNVSEALNLFASSLPWKPGDNVVLCPELEHPNNVFLWYNLRKLRGIEVRAVEPDGGRIPVEALAAAMDGRTALVTIPHVSFSPGFITDVRGIADPAHARGALVLVDAAQSVGSLRCDVDELGIDALAVATQKSLLAFYGLGFLFVRRALAESLIPAHVARYGMDMGAEAGETARTGGENLPYAPGARRFDLGNYNYLGAQAAEASMRLIASIGVPRIEAHLRALSARLVEGLLELGLPVAGGPPGPHLGHIVAVGQSGGGHHDTADDPAMNDLYRHLTSHGVHLSIRKGVLRMSLGLHNDPSDVDRVLGLVREWVQATTDR